ncbi:MFS transporter [Chengkuizengella sediminis]|uniref:MFS transporter n=1 Tax=Chengkuizengella sediminis TaxID=1885917 RepID=UPI00138946B2|nr:MFS transporter [Chengkuizengella sediminis]NDI35229.1 MFS transporter [Chengkuizengella sediminis]
MSDTRNIVLISISRLISELGSVALRFALSLYILDITGSPLMFGFVFGFTYIPGVIVNLFAGVLIDRSNKKKILIAADLLSGITTILFLVLFLVQPANIGLLICYVIILYSFQAVFLLAMNAAIPELVSKSRVMAVNSNIQSISTLLSIVGLFVGAFAYGAFGIEMVFLIDGISFILSGIINVFFVFRKKSEESLQNNTYWQSMKEVHQYIKDRNELKYLLGIFLVINFMFVPIVTLVMPYIMREIYEMSEFYIALIEGALGLGLIVGALLVAIKKIGRFVINKIFILFQLLAFMTVLWVFPELPFISINSSLVILLGYMIILTFMGMFNSMANIPMVSYVQIYIPEKMRASFFGIVTTVATMSVPVGLWIYGAALEMISWIYLTTISGVTLIIIGFIAHRNQELREFFSREQDDHEDHMELNPIEVVESN